MQIKNELRKKAREKRAGIENKDAKDDLIVGNLLSFSAFKEAETIFCYASLDEEIKTDEIVLSVLKSDKNLALPRCMDKNGKMDFFLIESLSDLEDGSFGIKEPIVSKCKKAESFENALVIVPMLMADKNGFRLGYGRGYYDRFLNKNNVKSIGLCYDEMIVSQLPVDEYDKKIDYLATQSGVISFENGGKNG